MNYKVLFVVMVFLLSFSAVSAAYDLEVQTIALNGNNPTEGQSQSMQISLKNNGPDNITAESITITVDFADGNVDTLTLTDLTSGQTTSLSTSNTWTNGGSYTITATASGMANDNNAANNAKTLTVKVNNAPTINAIPAQTATVGQLFSLQAIANDPDSNPLTYSLTGQPSGMTIDSNGLITWTPTATLTTKTVTVQVSDGVASDSTTFTIEAFNPGADLSTSVNTLALGSSTTGRTTQVTKTFTVTNMGSETLTNLAATALASNGATLSTDYNAQVTISQATLASGASATVTVIMTVPENANSQETTVGKIEVSAQGLSTQIVKNVFVTMEAESYLRIKDVELEVNGDGEGDLDDGDNYDELKEGDEITLKITIENRYSSSDDIEIENAYVEVEDDNWDIEEESDEEDLKDGDDYEFEITFTLDDDLDDDSSEFIIRAYGDDEVNGFEHYDELRFELEIEREDDEILIRSITWDNEPASCLDTYATLNVRFKNTGTDDQDEAAILVQVDELDWYKRIIDIELDEGDSETQEFKIPVRGVKEGSYFVEVSTYYRNDRKTDSEVVPLQVVCSTTSNTNTDDTTGSSNPTTGGSTGGIIVTQPGSGTGVVTQPTTQQPNYGEPVTAQVKDNNDTYIIALAILVFILLLAVIALMVRVLR